ncbi:MAG: folylpolyglutamate synthase/dihydrofolate synthase family protein [Lysinibacillus sp.]
MIPYLEHYKEKWQVVSETVIKPGLEAIESALALVGNPQQHLNVVHLAGTNGKGSTLTFLEAIATEHGIRVGKFMSPCILDVHDQIQVAGEPISADDMDSVFKQMREAGLSAKLTDFELLTVAAFMQFQRKNVEVVLLEAGMGGLLDSTNVVHPIVSIIPSIALEHTRFLGDTLASIAHHKAGIIKDSRPVIIGELPDEAKHVVLQEAKAKKAPVLALGDQFYVEQATSGEKYTNEENGLSIENINRSMKGWHQAHNMALAITAFFEVATELGKPISLDFIKIAVETAVIPGRFEEVLPSIIFDGAHNPASAEKLVLTIKEQFPQESITFVVGMLADKGVKEVLRSFEEIADSFYFVDVQNTRAMPAEEMLAQSNASDAHVLKDYIPFLTKRLKVDNRIIITGSLYLLAKIRLDLIRNYQK